MFGTKLFQKSIEPRCAYCARSVKLEEERVLCSKRGLVSPGEHCRLFRYDPLKRTPPRPPKLDLSGLDDEVFRL